MSKAKEVAKNANAEVGTKLKGFRSNPEIENFYRFVSENDLRCEARKALETIHKRLVKNEKAAAKKSKKRAKKARTLN